jgi:hypothetical protein
MTTDPVILERTFDLPGRARLTLLNVRGEIDVQAGEPGRITARAIKHPGRGFDRTEIEMTQAPDGAVTLATRYADSPGFFGFGRGEPARVDYVVRVPPACDLDLSYVSGPARVAGLEGSLKIRGVSGALLLAGLGGRLDVKTISGPVDGRDLRLAEPLSLSTVSGDVTLAGSALPGVDAHTVSGRLRLALSSAAGAHRLRSVSGDVHLTLPASAVCAVHVQSVSGGVHSRLPRRGQPGEPTVTVSFHSVSGRLHLDPAGSEAPPAEDSAGSRHETARAAQCEHAHGAQAEHEPGAHAAEHAAGRTAAGRLAVLEKVARGELDVDGALDALKT